MNLDAITQVIVTAAPAITAVITALVSLIVSIKKVKNTSEHTIKEVRESHRELRSENADLKKELRDMAKENNQLKRDLEEVLARMKHLYYVEKPENKEE